MDPSLLKDRAEFKKRALSQPVVEKKKPSTTQLPPPDHGPLKKKHKPSVAKPEKDTPFDYKTAIPPAQQNKFGALAKVVNYLKVRHHRGDSHPLTIEDVLDEAGLSETAGKYKQWLATEALINNPKVEVVNGSTFLFKPKLPIRNRNGLLRLLDKYDTRGLGGVLMDDVDEAVPNAQKAVEKLKDQILIVTRPDKKKILFYNDQACHFTVDEEFQKLWRGVAVEGMDEKKIDEYLGKQGITSMQDIGMSKGLQKRKGPVKKKPRSFKKLNEHLTDVLVDYD